MHVGRRRHLLTGFDFVCTDSLTRTQMPLKSHGHARPPATNHLCGGRELRVCFKPEVTQRARDLTCVVKTEKFAVCDGDGYRELCIDALHDHVSACCHHAPAFFRLRTRGARNQVNEDNLSHKNLSGFVLARQTVCFTTSASQNAV